MALGVKTEIASGEFLPRIQYDARAGRFFRIERYQDAGGTWSSDSEEIQQPVRLAMDLDNIEVGWIKLNNGVDFQMVRIGEALPNQPTTEHKQGFRVLVYSKPLGVRTWNHSAKCVLQSMDALHDAFLAARQEHPGEIPVVAITKTVPVTSGQGTKSSTNYHPVMEIEKWIPRPAEMSAAPAAKPAAAPAQAAPQAAKPSGHVNPPVQQQAAPVRELVGADTEF